MTRIRGSVYGMLRNGSRSIRFRIKEIIVTPEDELVNNDEQEELHKLDEIAIDPDFNLPTQSPWVLFDINVERIKGSHLFYVTKIFSCSRVTLTMKKDVIIDYYSNALDFTNFA